jgi:hypothetical protein
MAQRWMKYHLGVSVILVATSIVVGCATPIKETERIGKIDVRQSLEGIWEDTETHTRHTIQWKGETLTVSSIVNDDGEVYEVTIDRWEGGVLTWTYRVPSTGSVVNFTTQNVQGNTLWCTWSGPGGSGTQEFRRAK